MPHSLFQSFQRTKPLSAAVLASVLWGAAADAQTAQSQDVRDLAALLLFNGSQGGRAFDNTGPIADDDAIWSRDSAGSYSFASRRAGVTVRGSKSVSVEKGCWIAIATKFEWLSANKPPETLERMEEFDFRSRVIADAILATQGDRPFAVILDLKSEGDFYCKSTTINGRVMERRQCSQAVRLAVGPGTEDSPVLQYFAAYSKACKGES